MELKRPFVKPLLLAAALLLLLPTYLRLTAAPSRQFADSEWFFHERQRPDVTDLEPDPTIYRAIARAKRDYFIAPATSGSRSISFGHAWTVDPNDAYLAFGNGEADFLIVYRCTRESGELLWKATEAQSH